MSKIVLGIHGLANKPDPVTLYDNGWKPAMLEGLAVNCRAKDCQFNFEGVYWADNNYESPLTQFSPYKPAAPGEIKTYEESAVEELFMAATGAGGKIIDWFKETLDVRRAADKVLERRLPDLHKYYTEPDNFAELTGRMSEALERHADKRIMLIAHSMGSIVAYDALRLLGQQNKRIDVDHFVTIGSPLGLPHVKMKLVQSYRNIRTPSIVKRWTNFADRRDPVAADEHLRDDFKANVSGVRVKDDLILNDWKVDEGNNIHHNAYGYLRTPEFSKALIEFL